MSLVQLANVCSHLQNASLARLGLTSIPYTKLHLSLALLLQKQGFLSHVKLGGPSPPASVFGQGPRDNHHITNYPHGAAGRNRFSPEAALALVVRKHYTSQQLRSIGFPEESIAFAQEHGRRSLEDMQKLGFAAQIPRFIADINARINALAEEREIEFQRQRDEGYMGGREGQRRIDELHKTFGKDENERREHVEQDVLASLDEGHRAIYARYRDVPPSELESTSYDHETLSTIAGDAACLTEREIRLNGITVQAMGLPVSNQSVTLPMEEYQDPDHLETEGIVTQANRASRRLWLGLKYFESKPVLSKAKMISMPTKRIWLNGRDIGRLVRGSQAGEVKPLTRVGEIMAISTDRGIMEARECVERKIGGQPLCRVW